MYAALAPFSLRYAFCRLQHAGEGGQPFSPLWAKCRGFRRAHFLQRREGFIIMSGGVPWHVAGTGRALSDERRDGRVERRNVT